MHESPDEHALERILGKNEEMAEHNSDHFQRSKTCVFNLMSAPGAGKTTLLEATLRSTKKQFTSAVIEGDMVGDLDADRIKALNVPVYQISTGRSCHLDAQMVGRLLHAESIVATQALFIENVGNLVCPAEFPLGEFRRVVLLSVTEGDDKPIKYPVIFRNCDLVVFTKCDLLEYVNFDLSAAEKNLKALNPKLKTLRVSSKTGDGIDEWINWLNNQMTEYQAQLKNEHHVHHSAH